jgi:hypothetical protein
MVDIIIVMRIVNIIKLLNIMHTIKIIINMLKISTTNVI